MLHSPILLAFALLAPGFAHADAAPAKAQWSQKIGGGAGPLALQASDGVLVVVTWEGVVEARDAATGKKLWSAKAPREVVADDPAIARVGDVVVIRWPEVDTLDARHVRTGKAAWTRTLSAAALNVVACEQHNAVVATHRGQNTLMATAVDPATGEPLWSVSVVGDLTGAGGPYVFTAKRSGLGRLDASLEAVACADGTRTSVVGAKRDFVRFLHAAEGRVAAVFFQRSFTNQQLCAGPVGQPLHCLATTDGEVADYPVQGALLKDGALFFSTQHIEAHNLNQSPDGWLFRYDLEAGKYAWRSGPLTAGHALADAGAVIATAFGTTGIADFAYLIDPATGARVATLPLKKGPAALTADAERAYVGVYGGQVSALKLPLPGLKPKPRVAVEKMAGTVLTTVEKATDMLGWEHITVLDAHPKKGSTSGQKAPGTVLDVAFLDTAGDRIAAAGNDDRVHVLDVASGKELWKSKGMGKDVQRVQACASGTFAVQTYAGNITVFEAAGKGYRARRTVKHGGGWTFGFESGCLSVVADDYDGKFTVYDAITGKPKGNFVAPGVFDRRGLRVVDRGLVVSRGGALQQVDLAELPKGGEPRVVSELATPAMAHDAKLVQAFTVNDKLWLREYCGPGVCVVELIKPGGEVVGVERFDTNGGVWVPSVPSTIAVDSTGRWMVWHRDGLEMQLVALGKEQRRGLRSVTRTMSGTPSVAFSRDGTKLAIAMSPEPWQITVLGH